MFFRCRSSLSGNLGGLIGGLFEIHTVLCVYFQFTSPLIRCRPHHLPDRHWPPKLAKTAEIRHILRQLGRWRSLPFIQIRMEMGAYPEVSLKAAREMRDEAALPLGVSPPMDTPVM